VIDHITREQFLLEFFGNFGRDLGNPTQVYHDNPSDILTFVEECARDKKQAFMSIQPRTAHDMVYGIEKVFWDFDYGTKSEELTESQIKKRKKELEVEMRIFINKMLEISHGIQPLIVKTRKGYHVYLFFDSIYEISSDIDYWNNVYKELQMIFIKGNSHEYVYFDSVSSSIKNMARIPTSIHEISGEECKVVDVNFELTKLRELDFYRLYGLKRKHLQLACDIVTKRMSQRKKDVEIYHEESKSRWEETHGFVGQIRPCYMKRIEKNTMCHAQRLALLNEAFYSGCDTVEKMIDLFRRFKDFKEKLTRYHVGRFFKDKMDKTKEESRIRPYRCETIMEKGWCIEEDCPIWLRKRGRINGK